MRINKNCKVEMVVSKEATRPQIQDVFFDKAENVLIATDGKAMAVLPIEDSLEDTAGYIPKDALKEGRKIKHDTFMLKCNGNITNEYLGKTYNRPADQTYPNWKAVIPKYEKKLEISLDLNLLSR